MATVSHIEFGFVPEKKGFSPNLINQVHGSRVVGLESSSPVPDADAIWTMESKKEIYVFAADCLPVLLYDEDPQGPIAAIHSGWRGTMAGITTHVFAQLQKKSRHLIAILGPCLGPCCFEVKDDFISTFTQARGDIGAFLCHREKKNYFDLPRFVRERELTQLSPDEIDLTHWRCTYCSVPPLPSFRRNGTTEQRIRAWIKKGSGSN